QPGQGYTLQSTSASLSAGTSAAFDVTDQLVVTTQPPSSVTAGAPFGLVVTAEDGLGHVDTSFQGSVTIAGAYGATRGGTPTGTAVDGVATFSDLTLTQANPSVALYVSSNSLAATTTGSFRVTAAPATRLAVSLPSSPVLTGAPFQLTVNAVDAYGNVDP